MKQATRKTRRPRTVSADIRERLLDAALVEFGAKGFDGASTRAIAARIGAHQPQINYHFASKEALWAAAVDHLFAELARVMDGLAERVNGPGSRDVTEVAAVFAEIIRRFAEWFAPREKAIAAAAALETTELDRARQKLVAVTKCAKGERIPSY